MPLMPRLSPLRARRAGLGRSYFHVSIHFITYAKVLIDVADMLLRGGRDDC